MPFRTRYIQFGFEFYIHSWNSKTSFSEKNILSRYQTPPQMQIFLLSFQQFQMLLWLRHFQRMLALWPARFRIAKLLPYPWESLKSCLFCNQQAGSKLADQENHMLHCSRCYYITFHFPISHILKVFQIKHLVTTWKT